MHAEEALPDGSFPILGEAGTDLHAPAVRALLDG